MPLRLRFRARWLAVAAIGLVCLLYYKPLRTYVHTRSELSQRRTEVRSLRAEKLALERRAALVGSGQELIRQARRLGLVKAGERLFIVKGVPAWRHARAAGRR